MNIFKTGQHHFGDVPVGKKRGSTLVSPPAEWLELLGVYCIKLPAYLILWGESDMRPQLCTLWGENGRVSLSCVAWNGWPAVRLPNCCRSRPLGGFTVFLLAHRVASVFLCSWFSGFSVSHFPILGFGLVFPVKHSMRVCLERGQCEVKHHQMMPLQ